MADFIIHFNREVSITKSRLFSFVMIYWVNVDLKEFLQMNGKNRSDVYAGLEVDIVLKKDQRTGTTTRGVVKDLLTNSSSHPHGIKVRLTDGQIGRVCQTYPKQ